MIQLQRFIPWVNDAIPRSVPTRAGDSHLSSGSRADRSLGNGLVEGVEREKGFEPSTSCLEDSQAVAPCATSGSAMRNGAVIVSIYRGLAQLLGHIAVQQCLPHASVVQPCRSAALQDLQVSVSDSRSPQVGHAFQPVQICACQCGHIIVLSNVSPRPAQSAAHKTRHNQLHGP